MTMECLNMAMGFCLVSLDNRDLGYSLKQRNRELLQLKDQVKTDETVRRDKATLEERAKTAEEALRMNGERLSREADRKLRRDLEQTVEESNARIQTLITELHLTRERLNGEAELRRDLEQTVQESSDRIQTLASKLHFTRGRLTDEETKSRYLSNRAGKLEEAVEHGRFKHAAEIQQLMSKYKAHRITDLIRAYVGVTYVH
eukprot:GHVS01034724.1.p1 GENE.GHVS01034724.1~~GHVS01034724.1.p1  ORF type:complete len:202 (+),score=17.42 GHVS01034724.1:134-739(+)